MFSAPQPRENSHQKATLQRSLICLQVLYLSPLGQLESPTAAWGGDGGYC